jgi:hypothetical protein
VRADELEHELRPARALERGRPGWQGISRKPLEQGALLEGAVCDHRNAAVARQREDTTFHLPIQDVVRELDEIERMLAHDALELLMSAALGCGDADVANLAPGLLLEKGFEVCLPGEKVVDLKEIETRDAPVPARSLDLPWAGGARVGPDLVGREQTVGPTDLR